MYNANRLLLYLRKKELAIQKEINFVALRCGLNTSDSESAAMEGCFSFEQEEIAFEMMCARMFVCLSVYIVPSK